MKQPSFVIMIIAVALGTSAAGCGEESSPPPAATAPAVGGGAASSSTMPATTIEQDSGARATGGFIDVPTATTSPAR